MGDGATDKKKRKKFKKNTNKHATPTKTRRHNRATQNTAQQPNISTTRIMTYPQMEFKIAQKVND